MTEKTASRSAQEQAAAPVAAGAVFTIGHSNVPLERLVAMLNDRGVEVLVDVRSVPHSRYVPEANRETLRPALAAAGMQYLFLGDRLGGRPQDVDLIDGAGRQDYSRLAEDERFRAGLDRVVEGAARRRVCLLCSEEDPARCHRGFLIGRELARRGVDVRHIRHDGSLEPQSDLARRLPPVQKSLF